MPLFLAGLLAVAAVSLRAREKEPRIHLAPVMEKGQTIRYRIDTQTTVLGSTTSPIVNPEGPKKENYSTSLEIRLEVVDAPPAASSASGGAAGARLRVTYDVADATSSSDAYDPSTAAFDDTYKKLQGRSMEFTMTPEGGITGISGLEDIFENPSVAKSEKAWISSFNYSGGMPKEGIAIGQKWSRQIPAENLPLRGLFWRVESTYLRNENCTPQAPPDTDEPAAEAAAPERGKPDLCAVILTESSLSRRGSSRGDATPDDYAHNGLRTSGTWTATGESLDSLSLKSGWIVVSTETVEEKMDYEIKSVQSGSALHHTGSVKTQTHIAMLPPAPSVPPSQAK